MLDVKFRDFNDWAGVTRTDGEVPARPGRNEKYQVWQPIISVPEQIEEWLWRIEKDPPAILLVDELAALIYKKTQTSIGYTRLQKLGRGLPVGVVTLTQEFSGIPGSAVKQSVHNVVFRMGRSPYESQMASLLLDDEYRVPADKYGFYYQHETSAGKPLYYPSHEKFLGF